VDLPTFGRPTIPQFKGILFRFLLFYWNMREAGTSKGLDAKCAKEKRQVSPRLPWRPLRLSSAHFASRLFRWLEALLCVFPQLLESFSHLFALFRVQDLRQGVNLPGVRGEDLLDQGAAFGR